ncbi:AP-3 complex subunit beta-1-like isoform X2 [Dendronephthya gigantea]|uniref:AP-3 complex subunit beta-1-like isoform X2 n=1 Tax=Dendronephthya gigantea TaxID=151771 RepID=UPI001068E3EF|nr:AP-3 complex subunit beta-1-like isoform X2 [Dendronephthya gigantea]
MSEKGVLFHGESSLVKVESNVVVIDPTVGDKVDKLASRLQGGLNLVRNKLRSRTSIDQDPDVGESSSGRIFAGKFKRNADLNELLDSSKDRDKLEAMRRIIENVSSGKDVSNMFASVVKNVVSKNPEIKKLVYVYLVRYAEEQQDLALLSISTFQKALKDPNQLIRASALRVLSSIRVSIIVPIMMLAIKEAVTDMSPFVRKTACHAIPKLYSLDPELKEPLVEVIEKLLKDKTTLVSGSAVMAFEELCPDRIDLIHKNYRKLCNLLVDIDEWGQSAVIHMLTRYARSQFLDPNKADLENEKFYPESDGSQDEDDDDDDDDDNNEKTEKKKPYIMDPDHRLLLRVTKPLLQSRNAAVVMAVARLYHHCAPASEVGVVTRALVRLLKGHREVQYVVLSNIATLSATRKGMFESHLKSFFVHSNDSSHIKTLKLEIMTNIASETNITILLREFQTYINNADKQFVASTIQAIGRCASNIPEVTDTCLAGLVKLLSNRDETVVAESVVMIKKLLQLKHKDKSQIITQMAKILNKITVPMARASILWLVGEYAERVPKLAPDVLRMAAKTFIKEEDIVKLQIINLGAKLILVNPTQTQQLCQYVLNLAKYDQSYDIRDRARFLRPIVFPGEKTGQLVKHSKKILLASKPPPALESVFKDHGEFMVGSLSHILNARASGYQELPEFPEVPPDPSVRNVEVEPIWEKKTHTRSKKKSSFYSSESESGSESGSGSGSESGSETESGSEEVSDSESKSSMESLPGTETESQQSDDEYDNDIVVRKKLESRSSIESKTSEEDSDSDIETSENESTESEEEKETLVKKAEKFEKTKPKAAKQVEPRPSSTDQLLIFDEEVAPIVNGTSNTHNSVLSPSLIDDMKTLSLGVTTNGPTPVVQNVVTDFSKLTSHELLNKITGQGLQAQYKFSRSPCIFSTTMVAVEVTFVNNSGSVIENIRIGEKKLSLGLKMSDFPTIDSIDVGSTVTVTMGVDFKDTIQPVSFEICTKSNKFSVKVNCPMGEQLQASPITEQDFINLQKKLSGMNESSLTADIPTENCDERKLISLVLGCASVGALPKNSSSNIYRFSGVTISSGVPVLITVDLKKGGKGSKITVNCEKMTINSILAKELVAAVKKVS